MANFEERLKRAIERGSSRAEAQAREARKKALSEDDLKTLHGKYRLELSDHVEHCVRQLPSHFPGFRYETIYGERGWGGACSRDDFESRNGERSNVYSRLEMTVRPYSSLHVLELAAKGTVRDKELFNRSHYKPLEEVDIDGFLELVNAWSIEYAESFAAI